MRHIITSALAVMFAAGLSMTALGATAQDVIARNQTSYTAGTKSIYGPSLNQNELNEVAAVVADFVSEHITDGMSEAEKIRAAHDYLVRNCSYAADWSKNRANTAWGALVYHEAQCSGYSRAFKALCDASGIECLYIHADNLALNPSHQWNMVKMDGNWYYIDVQANDSSCYDAFYLVHTLPMSYDMTGYPKVADQNADVERYQMNEGPYADTVVPEPLSLEDAQKLELDFLPQGSDDIRMVDGVECFVIPAGSDQIQLISAGDLDLSLYHFCLALFAFREDDLQNDTVDLLDDCTFSQLQLGQPVSLDFTGQNRSAAELREYCLSNHLIIIGFIYDENQAMAYAREHGAESYFEISDLISGAFPSFEIDMCYQQEGAE